MERVHTQILKETLLEKKDPLLPLKWHSHLWTQERQRKEHFHENPDGLKRYRRRMNQQLNC